MPIIWLKPPIWKFTKAVDVVAEKFEPASAHSDWSHSKNFERRLRVASNQYGTTIWRAVLNPRSTDNCFDAEGHN
jgi:hypothetical protein